MKFETWSRALVLAVAACSSSIEALPTRRSGGDGVDYEYRGVHAPGKEAIARPRNLHFKSAFRQPLAYKADGEEVKGYDEEGPIAVSAGKRGHGHGGNNHGYDREGYDRAGYNREGYDREGYDRNGCDDEGYNEEGYECGHKPRFPATKSGTPQGRAQPVTSVGLNVSNEDEEEALDEGLGEDDETAEGDSTNVYPAYKPKPTTGASATQGAAPGPVKETPVVRTPTPAPAQNAAPSGRAEEEEEADSADSATPKPSAIPQSAPSSSDASPTTKPTASPVAAPSNSVPKPSATLKPAPANPASSGNVAEEDEEVDDGELEDSEKPATPKPTATPKPEPSNSAVASPVNTATHTTLKPTTPAKPSSGSAGSHDGGYDREGYDREGYDRHGYDREGYDRAGYDRDGYDEEGYDRRGYDRKGYDEEGYDREGYDGNGCDDEGYDRRGYECRDTRYHQRH